MGSRISNPALTDTNYLEAISNEGKLLVDWAALAAAGLEARPILVKLLGNARFQGSSDGGATWSSIILSSHTLLRISTTGGAPWTEINLGNLNKIISTGDGTLFLSNDGTYKSIASLFPSTFDHNELSNLDYASSGHTGFEPSRVADQNYVTDAQLAVLVATSGTNTGDETESSILDKLGVTDVVTSDDLAAATKQTVYTFTLPASATVAGRVAGTIAYGTGTEAWTITAGSSPVDLLVTHDLIDRKIIDVQVYSTGLNGDRLLVPFSSAYSGILASATDEVLIEGLSTKETPLIIHLTFN